jgi:hypothetical protein
MIGSISHKRGDSIRWTINYKQSSGTAYDLTGFTVVLSIKDKTNSNSILEINSNIFNSNHQITTNEFNIGKFQVIIKDTKNIPIGDYYVDIEYTDANGYKQSSEAFNLKIANRL